MERGFMHGIEISSILEWTSTCTLTYPGQDSSEVFLRDCGVLYHEEALRSNLAANLAAKNVALLVRI
jgi:hypothetical protein